MWHDTGELYSDATHLDFVVYLVSSVQFGVDDNLKTFYVI